MHTVLHTVGAAQASKRGLPSATRLAFSASASVRSCSANVPSMIHCANVSRLAPAHELTMPDGQSDATPRRRRCHSARAQRDRLHSTPTAVRRDRRIRAHCRTGGQGALLGLRPCPLSEGFGEEYANRPGCASRHPRMARLRTWRLRSLPMGIAEAVSDLGQPWTELTSPPSTCLKMGWSIPAGSSPRAVEAAW